ncbi:MAG: glycosyltransferase family 2 protein, partial [Candidatus Bathyarchaeia archaeon]
MPESSIDPLGPLVGVVVVNYNSSNRWNIVSECIKAVLKLKYRPLETVIVDNGSSDDSLERINSLVKSCKPADIRVRVVALSKNHGFAGGNNVGFGVISETAKYIALINNDLCPQPGSLDDLVSYLEENPDVAGVQGKILQWNKPLIDSSGMYWTSLSTCLARGLCMPSNSDRLNEVVDVSYADGAYTVYGTNALRSVGDMFDSRLFLHAEDTELGLRLWHAGYKVRSIPIVVGKHYRSLTSKSYDWALFYYPYRNAIILTIWYAKFWLLTLLLRIPHFIFVSLLQRSNLVIRALIDGFITGMRNSSIDRCRKSGIGAPVVSIQALELYAFMLCF